MLQVSAANISSLVGCHEFAVFHLVGTLGLGIWLGFQLLTGLQDVDSFPSGKIPFFCWKGCSVTMTHAYEFNRAPQDTFQIILVFFSLAVDVDEFCCDVVL